MNIIACGNRKGGVGKSTTAVSLAAIFASRWNRKTLAIDLDDQGNLTRGFGIKRVDMKETIYPVLSGFCDLLDVIRPTYLENLSLCAADKALRGAEIELPFKEANDIIDNHKTVLKTALAEVQDLFDLCLIDLGPSLGPLVLNGLECADTLLMPVSVDMYAIEAIDKFLPFVKCPHVILRTRFDRRQSIHKRLSDIIEQRYNGHILTTIIRENTTIQNAVTDGKDIVSFDEQSNGARDYLALAKELVERGVV
jgi:chromosome partitioning protein